MPKKLLKKYMPHPSKIKEHKSLRFFGRVLHEPNLWHLNRASVPRAVAIGLFCCFMPIPFQMVLAAAIAIFWRANLPIAVVLVWISNPLTMPPLFYFAYRVGSWLLSRPPGRFSIELSFAWLTEQLQWVWQPLIIGSLACGLVSAVLGFWLTRLFWRYWVVKHWQKRKLRSRKSAV